MIDLELHSDPASPKQYTLFIRRLRIEFKRPGSRGVRDSQDGFLYAPPPDLKDMEEELDRAFKGAECFHHLEIQPDDDLPTACDYLYDLSDLVKDTIEPLRNLSREFFTWVAVPHPSHGMFPHAHVFISGPRLKEEWRADMRAAAERSWDNAVDGCREAEANRMEFYASMKRQRQDTESRIARAPD